MAVLALQVGIEDWNAVTVQHYDAFLVAAGSRPDNNDEMPVTILADRDPC